MVQAHLLQGWELDHSEQLFPNSVTVQISCIRIAGQQIIFAQQIPFQEAVQDQLCKSVVHA